MLHDDAKQPAPKRSAKGVTGLTCCVCHRPSARPVRVTVEYAGNVVAAEDAELCEKCWKDRFAVRAAVERTTRSDQ